MNTQVSNSNKVVCLNIEDLSLESNRKSIKKRATGISEVMVKFFDDENCSQESQSNRSSGDQGKDSLFPAFNGS